MEYQTYYVSKNLYSIELKHKVCKEHINEATRLRDLVRKYNISSHSLINSWLRSLGYLPGNNRRITKCNYIGIENFKSLSDKRKKKQLLTQDQQLMEVIKKGLEDGKLLA